jgi:hypothetical protein
MNPRYSEGYEWMTDRGQVYVMQSTHPFSRKDGFVARSKLVMETMLSTGLQPNDSYEDYAIKDEPRLLRPEERVYHLDGNVSNDDPENLMLFPNQKALAQYRSMLHREARELQDRQTLEDFNRIARDMNLRRKAAANKRKRLTRTRINTNKATAKAAIDKRNAGRGTK